MICSKYNEKLLFRANYCYHAIEERNRPLGRKRMMPNRDEEEQIASTTGPVQGDFIAPIEFSDVDEKADALPQQEEF